MKKIISFLMIICLLLSGCSDTNNTSNENGDNSIKDFSNDKSDDSNIDYIAKLQGWWICPIEEGTIYISINDNSFSCGYLDSEGLLDGNIIKVEDNKDGSIDMSVKVPGGYLFGEYQPETLEKITFKSFDNYEKSLEMNEYTYVYAGKTLEEVYNKLSEINEQENDTKSDVSYSKYPKLSMKSNLLGTNIDDTKRLYDDVYFRKVDQAKSAEIVYALKNTSKLINYHNIQEGIYYGVKDGKIVYHTMECGGDITVRDILGQDAVEPERGYSDNALGEVFCWELQNGYLLMMTVHRGGFYLDKYVNQCTFVSDEEYMSFIPYN